jgi:hypothetical protein
VCAGVRKARGGNHHIQTGVEPDVREKKVFSSVRTEYSPGPHHPRMVMPPSTLHE